MTTVLIDSPLATIEHLPSSIYLIRLKPEALLEEEAIVDLLDHLAHLEMKVPFSVIAMVPEEMDFEVRAMYTEFALGRSTANLLALAVVTTGSLYRRMSEIYFRNFPLDRPVQVFDGLDKAIAWVNEESGSLRSA